MSQKKVLISILNWNSPLNTCDAIKSVLNSSFKNFTIIVVDNNSNDRSVEQIRNSYPNIRILALEKNMGYAGGHKYASDIAFKEKYDFLWILNNDVKVFDDTLQGLLAASERHRNCIFGSIEIDEHRETIQFGGGAEIIDNFTNDESICYNHFANHKMSETTMTERPVSDLCGSSLFIPIPIIKKYGFIDTRYFLYSEETDYCYRLRRNFGIQSIIVPNSAITHATGSSFKKDNNLQYVRAYYQSRNNHYFYNKYFANYSNPEVGGILHYLKYFLKYFISVIFNQSIKETKLTYYRKLGHFHALLKIRGKYLDPNNFLDHS